MYNIEFIVNLSGLSKRTIRYYIEMGLMEPPVGNCRGSYYTDIHLERLELIKKWAQQGIPLTKIKDLIKEDTEPIGEVIDHIHALCTEKWEKMSIDDGIELNFKEGKLKTNELKKICSFVKELMKCKNYDN